MARWLGLGLGRSGCTGCGRRRADRRCARWTLLRLRPVLPRALLSGPAACLLRLSSAAAWLSSASAWLCGAARRFRWRPSGLLHAALPVL